MLGVLYNHNRIIIYPASGASCRLGYGCNCTSFRELLGFGTLLSLSTVLKVNQTGWFGLQWSWCDPMSSYYEFTTVLIWCRQRIHEWGAYCRDDEALNLGMYTVSTHQLKINVVDKKFVLYVIWLIGIIDLSRQATWLGFFQILHVHSRLYQFSKTSIKSLSWPSGQYLDHSESIRLTLCFEICHDDCQWNEAISA